VAAAPTRYPADLVLSGPRTSTSPAWVVAVQTDRISIWDERGSLLGEWLTFVAHWPERRTLFVGDTALRGIALDGTTTFEIPLGDFRVGQAVVVRFTPVPMAANRSRTPHSSKPSTEPTKVLRPAGVQLVIRT
jgi:hypothetical protein